MKSTTFPEYRGRLEYVCQGCGSRFPGDSLYYACPDCSGVFLLEDTRFEDLKQTSGRDWQGLFDGRMQNTRAELQGIFRFYELIAPVLEPEDILYLGEAQTPIIFGNSELQAWAGQPLAFKNEGQNPSGSFKDRGMACAFSQLQSLIRQDKQHHFLTICASTGDTSASAAMYAAYAGRKILSVVLLPQGKVTPQQLAQPLGSGARVFELPGVFDDAMRVVEYLSEHYPVALLNSKNSWRILGQESYAFEIAQWANWDVSQTVVFVPIGNAGNISAIMAGFLKLKRLKVIDTLPKVIGVQTAHADPVFRYYDQPAEKRRYAPVQVQASAAQAAMIGNPVSFPRVKNLGEAYQQLGGQEKFHVVQVSEQNIMDCTLAANRFGHIACTQGGECLAGLFEAKAQGLIDSQDVALLASTAHSLKFQNFQNLYFEDRFPPEYRITAKSELCNTPQLIDATLDTKDQAFARQAAQQIAERLNLESW